MKSKIKLILAIVLFACNVHSQELKIKVNDKGKVGFVDKQGNEVIKCQYESVSPFENGLSIVSKSKKYGLIDTNGNIVLPMKYSNISKWNNNVYLVKNGKTMGLADRSGSIILPVKYSMISKTNCYGKAIIALGGKVATNDKKSYMNNAKYGIINADGNILITPQYKGLFEFSFDVTNVLPYREGKRLAYSYHYTTDTLITDCKYLGFNKNGLSIANCGILDENGNELMGISKYSFIMRPSSDMVRYYVANKKKTTIGYYNLKEKKNLEIAVIDKPIDDINYWSHGDFNSEIAPVNGDVWSFIDKTGNKVRTGYKGIRHSLHLNLWAAEKVGKWEVFDDLNNNVATLSNYEDILFPNNKDDEELYVVRKDNKYGVINKAGEVTIPMQYDQALPISYNTIPVKTGDKWGMISLDNKQIVPKEFSNILLPSEYNQEHYWVMKSDSLYYHYNVEAGKLSSTGFKGVQNFEKGLALVAPQNLVLENSMVNKALCFYPNADPNNISEVNLSEKRDAFGYVLNTDDNIVLDIPVSTVYIDKAKEKISSLGNRKLTKSEAKNLLLELTKENRTYGLKEILGEDEWNY